MILHSKWDFYNAIKGWHLDGQLNFIVYQKISNQLLWLPNEFWKINE